MSQCTLFYRESDVPFCSHFKHAVYFLQAKIKKQGKKNNNNILQHKKAQSLPFAIKQCINKNTLVVHLRYFHQWDFLPSSVLTRKQWWETQISGRIPVVSSPSPCPSKLDIKWPFKANLAAYACTESPAITPKCSLHHLDSCKVFLFGRQGTFVDITSRLVERKPGWTLCLHPPTGTAAWFSWVSGGRQECSFIWAALGTLHTSQHNPAWRYFHQFWAGAGEVNQAGQVRAHTPQSPLLFGPSLCCCTMPCENTPPARALYRSPLLPASPPHQGSSAVGFLWGACAHLHFISGPPISHRPRAAVIWCDYIHFTER